MSKGVELPSNRENLRYEIILQLCALYYQTIGKEIKTTDELNMSGRQGGLYKIYNNNPLQSQIEKVNISPYNQALLYYLLFCQVRPATPIKKLLLHLIGKKCEGSTDIFNK